MYAQEQYFEEQPTVDALRSTRQQYLRMGGSAEARGFESKGILLEHLLARKQEIHERVCRKTHQAQLRQEQKIGKHLKTKSHDVGDALCFFCNIIPKDCTHKLIRDRAWRGPH